MMTIDDNEVEPVAEGAYVTGGTYRGWAFEWYLGTCSNEGGPLRYDEATANQRDNIRWSLARGLERMVDSMSNHERIAFYRLTGLRP